MLDVLSHIPVLVIFAYFVHLRGVGVVLTLSGPV
jgi:hypothetical protein